MCGCSVEMEVGGSGCLDNRGPLLACNRRVPGGRNVVQCPGQTDTRNHPASNASGPPVRNLQVNKHTGSRGQTRGQAPDEMRQFNKFYLLNSPGSCRTKQGPCSLGPLGSFMGGKRRKDSLKSVFSRLGNMSQHLSF